MGAPTISPAVRNTFRFPCMVVDRFNKLYYIDGMSRGLVWDGSWPLMRNLGIDKATGPSIASDAAGGSLTQDGTYYAAIRYLDKYLTPGDLSEFDSVTGPAADPTWRIDWSVNPSTDPRVEFVELWRSAAGVSSLVYLIARLGNSGNVATITNSGGVCRITFSEKHDLDVNAQILVAGSSVVGYNVIHTVATVVNDLVVDTNIAYSANATTATWTLVGFINDGDSDSNLQANNESMNILNEDGTFNARRFGVPPSYKSVMIIFQDRAIYGVDVFYTKGTLSGSAGSINLTGSGTDWTTDMAGRQIIIDGESEPFTLETVTTATSGTIDRPLTANRSAVNYTITSPRDFLDTLIYSEADEPESVPIDPVLGYVNTIKVQKNTSDIADRETGLMPLGGNFYSLRERHVYRINFTRQPDIDAAINLVASRGCLNNRCWAQLDDVAYLMDDVGVYGFVGSGGLQPISLNIQTYWRQGTIDWTYKHWFFAAADRQLGIVRFFLRFTGDGGGERPRRALCFSPERNAWWIETYPWDIGHAAHALVAGQVRLLVGSEDDVIYKTNEGFTDNGTPFSASWKTGVYSFLVEEEQNLAMVEVVFPPTTAAESIVAQVYLDQDNDALVMRTDNALNQNWVGVAGTAGGTISTQRTRDTKGDQAGIARCKVGKRRDEMALNGLYIQVQLTWTQTTEQVAIYAVSMWGVE